MLIQLENISKTYKGNGIRVEALKGVDLEIEEGECIAVMGASGSGKSTLLNILGCMDRATEGEYYLNGSPVTSYPEKRMAELRNGFFGFVVQDFALIERSTVEKNVMLPLYYSSRYKKERKKRVEEILSRVGILEKRDQPAVKLSGGQRQRVAIARALVNDAKVLLCDEPTGALDSKSSANIMSLFRDLNKEGHTIILVTHDQNVADQCNRIVTINDGKIN